jgi:hypothetical protein
MSRNHTMRLIAFFVIALLALPVTAQVYRYVDKDGVVHYTDKPPSRDAKPVELPPLHTVPALEVAPQQGVRTAPVAEQIPEQGYTAARITSPQPEAIIRDAQRMVSISVNLSPPLRPGHLVRFELDGTPIGPALAQTSTSVHVPNPGEYRVSAAVLDELGREVQRTDSVKFFMRPPIARAP